MATMRAVARECENDSAGGLSTCRIGMRNGELALEHGLHQEIGWERRPTLRAFPCVFFADNIENPVIEAASHRGAATAGPAGASLHSMTRRAA